ncbi:hypothetical protein BJ165DRAFT_1410669 [Panaeolus papilionaceus]|nr:hypothetical protein BJ165DRAFT_1410669 [Panaeolus papilionaceus]
MASNGGPQPHRTSTTRNRRAPYGQSNRSATTERRCDFISYRTSIVDAQANISPSEKQLIDDVDITRFLIETGTCYPGRMHFELVVSYALSFTMDLFRYTYPGCSERSDLTKDIKWSPEPTDDSNRTIPERIFVLLLKKHHTLFNTIMLGGDAEVFSMCLPNSHDAETETRIISIYTKLTETQSSTLNRQADGAPLLLPLHNHKPTVNRFSISHCLLNHDLCGINQRSSTRDNGAMETEFCPFLGIAIKKSLHTLIYTTFLPKVKACRERLTKIQTNLHNQTGKPVSVSSDEELLYVEEKFWGKYGEFPLYKNCQRWKVEHCLQLVAFINEVAEYESKCRLLRLQTSTMTKSKTRGEADSKRRWDLRKSRFDDICESIAHLPMGLHAFHTDAYLKNLAEQPNPVPPRVIQTSGIAFLVSPDAYHELLSLYAINMRNSESDWTLSNSQPPSQVDFDPYSVQVAATKATNLISQYLDCDIDITFTEASFSASNNPISDNFAVVLPQSLREALSYLAKINLANDSSSISQAFTTFPSGSSLLPLEHENQIDFAAHAYTTIYDDASWPSLVNPTTTFFPLASLSQAQQQPTRFPNNFDFQFLADSGLDWDLQQITPDMFIYPDSPIQTRATMPLSGKLLSQLQTSLAWVRSISPFDFGFFDRGAALELDLDVDWTREFGRSHSTTQYSVRHAIAKRDCCFLLFCFVSPPVLKMPELVEGLAHYITSKWALDAHPNMDSRHVLGLYADLTADEAKELNITSGLIQPLTSETRYLRGTNKHQTPLVATELQRTKDNSNPLPITSLSLIDVHHNVRALVINLGAVWLWVYTPERWKGVLMTPYKHRRFSCGLAIQCKGFVLAFVSLDKLYQPVWTTSQELLGPDLPYIALEFNAFIQGVADWIRSRWKLGRLDFAINIIRQFNKVWVGIGAYTVNDVFFVAGIPMGITEPYYVYAIRAERMLPVLLRPSWDNGLLNPDHKERLKYPRTMLRIYGKPLVSLPRRLVQLATKHNMNITKYAIQHKEKVAAGKTNSPYWYRDDHEGEFPDPFEPSYIKEALQPSPKSKEVERFHLGHLIFGLQWDDIVATYPDISAPFSATYIQKIQDWDNVVAHITVPFQQLSISQASATEQNPHDHAFVKQSTDNNVAVGPTEYCGSLGRPIYAGRYIKRVTHCGYLVQDMRRSDIVRKVKSLAREAYIKREETKVRKLAQKENRPVRDTELRAIHHCAMAPEDRQIRDSMITKALEEHHRMFGGVMDNLPSSDDNSALPQKRRRKSADQKLASQCELGEEDTLGVGSRVKRRRLG